MNKAERGNHDLMTSLPAPAEAKLVEKYSWTENGRDYLIYVYANPQDSEFVQEFYDRELGTLGWARGQDTDMHPGTHLTFRNETRDIQLYMYGIYGLPCPGDVDITWYEPVIPEGTRGFFGVELSQPAPSAHAHGGIGGGAP